MAKVIPGKIKWVFQDLCCFTLRSRSMGLWLAKQPQLLHILKQCSFVAGIIAMTTLAGDAILWILVAEGPTTNKQHRHLSEQPCWITSFPRSHIIHQQARKHLIGCLEGIVLHEVDLSVSQRGRSGAGLVQLWYSLRNFCCGLWPICKPNGCRNGSVDRRVFWRPAHGNSDRNNDQPANLKRHIDYCW